MKLLLGLIYLGYAERQENEDNFVPPEKRFDFNKMGRNVKEDPNNPGQGILNYNLQTIEQSKEEEVVKQQALKFATPEELKIVHKQHLLDFERGQDLNLLANSEDISNLQIVIKSHRCDACRIVAFLLGREFWDLEERFSRKTRMLREEMVYDGLEAFCDEKRWENVGLTQTVNMNVSSSTTGIEKDLWRLTAPEFETWESRGEITATSQYWPLRFRKVCLELIEEFDEWELYEYWKKITKDSADPRTSDLDDLMCFSEKKSDCNRFRNPSKVKQEPVEQEILHLYSTFKDEINERRRKEREVDLNKLLREQKRVMNKALQRQKEKKAKEQAAKESENVNTDDSEPKNEL